MPLLLLVQPLQALAWGRVWLGWFGLDWTGLDWVVWCCRAVGMDWTVCCYRAVRMDCLFWTVRTVWKSGLDEVSS